MLSSDSVNQQQSFFRKCSFEPCVASNDVIKEIRSSLFLATSIIEDGAPNDYSLLIDGRRFKSIVHFQCGRLRYSQVKGEWSILHRPFLSCDDNMKKSNNTTCKNPVAMVIASLWPVSVSAPKEDAVHYKTRTKIARKRHEKESTKIQRRQSGRKCRKLLNDEVDVLCDIKDECFGSIDNSKVDNAIVQLERTGSILSSSTPGAYLNSHPTSPPIELVRCLLNGAEFISIMNCARREVETSIQKLNDDVDANDERMKKYTGYDHDEKAQFHFKAPFWSRRMTKNLKHRSINLQPMIIALAVATIDTILPSSKPSPRSSIITNETNDIIVDQLSPQIATLKFIDECIRFAHILTLDLIAPWSSCWQMRTNLRCEKVEGSIEDKEPLLSIADVTSSVKYRALSRLELEGNQYFDGRHNDNRTSISSKSVTTIQEFVKACLAQPREDILPSTAVVIGANQTSFSNGDFSRHFENKKYHLEFSPAPKQTVVSRRNKVFAREPADSLAATFMQESNNTIATAEKKFSTPTKEDPQVEISKHMKHSRHVSTPSPSVLENTATVDSRESKSSRTIRRSSGGKRKLSDSVQMARNRRIVRKKKRPEKKEHDNHDSGCHSVCDKDKMPPDSLYEFFDKKRINEIPRDKFSMKSSDKKGQYTGSHATSLETKEAKDSNAMSSRATTTRRSDWAMRFSLTGFETRMNKRDVLGVEGETGDEPDCCKNEQHQNKAIDSLHRLSKSSQPSTYKHWSSNAITHGTESLSESMDRNLSDKNNTEKTNIIESKVPNKKLRNFERESKNGSVWNKSPFDQVAKAFSNGGHTGVKEDPVNDITNNNEIALRAIKVKDSNDRKDRKFDKLADESPRFSRNPEGVCRDGKSKLDLQNLKSDFVSLGAAPSLPWADLSHIGHISDYHGYKRRYEHFAPLQFGSIDDIRKQIGRTLTESKGGNEDESDEEVNEDNGDYQRAIQKYEILARKERSLKTKSNIRNNIDVPPKSKKDSLGDVLVIFSSPQVDKMIAGPMASATTRKYDTQIFGDDESSTFQPPVNFRIFDDDYDFLLNAGEDDRNSKRRRTSRSAQIASQKKTSIRILNEMLHSLDFIERFNLKSKAVQSTMQEVMKEGIDGAGKDEDSFREKVSQRKVNARQSIGKIKGCRSLTNSKLPISVKSAFVTLNTVSLLESYKSLQKRYSSFHPLHCKGDIEAIKKEIQAILDKDSLLDEYFGDNEVICEERNLSRCIRRYSNKADQEKIEKRNFEEQQKLRQHEIEYYILRKKKRSPVELEWKKMLSRPIYYARDDALPRTRTDVCNLNPNCTICDQILDDKCFVNKIFSPRFRRIENDMSITPCIKADSNPVGGVTSTNSPSSKEQKLASSLKLLELYHTLDFVVNYNNGLIVSRRTR